MLVTFSYCIRLIKTISLAVSKFKTFLSHFKNLHTIKLIKFLSYLQICKHLDI